MSSVKTNVLTSLNGVDEISMPTMDQRFAKAWVNYTTTGSTVINDSYGIMSVVDSGLGVTQINFETVQSNSDYATVVCGSVGSGSPTFRTITQNTTGVSIQTFNNETVADASLVSVAIFAN